MIAGGNYSFDPRFSINKINSAKTTGLFDLSEVSEAVAEDAFIHSPTRSLYELARNQNFTGEDEGITLSTNDLKLKKDADYYAQYMNLSEPMTERDYTIKYAAKRAEMLRINTMARAPATLGQFMSNLGVALGMSMLDPTSIALGYMPAALARGGYVGVRAAQMATKFDASLSTANALGRAGLRAKAGALGGAFEGAVTEVPVYFAAQGRAEQYGAEDVFMSIATGVVVGTGIQVTGGALYDAATIEMRAFSREQLRIQDEMQLQKAADIETDVKLKAEKQKTVNDYKQAVAQSKQTPANLLKFTDPDFVGPISLADYEDWLLQAFIKSKEISGIQKKLMHYTQEERLALMQSGLAQFATGKRVIGHEFVQTFEARRLGAKYRPEDIEAVREEVEIEYIQQEIQLKGETRVGPKLENVFAENTKVLRNEIEALEQQVSKKLKKGTSKKVREKQQSQVRELAAKKRALSDQRSAFKARESQAKNIRDRLKMMRDGEYPADMKAFVDNEVARTMDIIDEAHLNKPEYQLGAKTDLSQGIIKSFRNIDEALGAPEISRTYRPEAQASFSESGRASTPSEDAAKREQQKTDAIENAKKLAQDNNTQYTLTQQEQDVINNIQQLREAITPLATCMGRSA